MMPFTLVCNDITKMHVDAVVNAANTSLQMGGGVCGAIFKAAGARELQAACNKLAPINTGEAVITAGFGLLAKHIIHTAGPVWQGGAGDEERLLYSCYSNSLKLAQTNGCESIAFPLISSGIYGYPMDGALRVAASSIRAFLQSNEMDVYLVLFNAKTLETANRIIGEAN